jgi:hypothetical protein
MFHAVNTTDNKKKTSEHFKEHLEKVLHQPLTTITAYSAHIFPRPSDWYVLSRMNFTAKISLGQAPPRTSSPTDS